MKLNKKMLNIPIILMIVISVLVLLNIPTRINMLKGIAGTDKIGIIALDTDVEGQNSGNKEEVFITDKQMLYNIINTINNGKINTDIKLDRPSADYQLNFYKNDNCIKGYYWKDAKEYNLNVEGVSGEITVDQKLGDLIESFLAQ